MDEIEDDKIDIDYSLEKKQDIEKREAFKEKLEGYMKIAKENPTKKIIFFAILFIFLNNC